MYFSSLSLASQIAQAEANREGRTHYVSRVDLTAISRGIRFFVESFSTEGEIVATLEAGR